MGIAGISRTAALAFLLTSLGACGDAGTDPGPGGDDKTLPGTWTQARDLPVALQGAGAAAFRGRIYVVGGALPGETNGSVRTYRYDPGADAWERVADLPDGVVNLALTVVGDTLLALGGNRTTNALTPVDHVWRWDEGSGGWVDHGDLPAPASSPRAAGTTAGTLLGGLGSSSFSFQSRGGNTWTTVAPAPFALQELVAGGGDAWMISANFGLAQYVSAEARWVDRQLLPTSGFLMGAAWLEGRLHLVTRLGTAVDHLAWDPAAKSASFFASPPASTRRNGALTVVMAGRLYVIGGSDAQAPLTRVDVFRP